MKNEISGLETEPSQLRRISYPNIFTRIRLERAAKLANRLPEGRFTDLYYTKELTVRKFNGSMKVEIWKDKRPGEAESLEIEIVQGDDMHRIPAFVKATKEVFSQDEVVEFTSFNPEPSSDSNLSLHSVASSLKHALDGIILSHDH